MNFKKFSFLILLVLIGFALKTLWDAGEFKNLQNSSDFSQSTLVEGAIGSEDIDIDHETGRAFLSSDNRWAFAQEKANYENGHIYLLNLNDSIPSVYKSTMVDKPTDFHPHGFNFAQVNGKKLLWVINHQKAQNVIELFEVKKDSLLHLKSFTHQLLVSPNDVLGINENEFYFTNDHDEVHSLKRTIKDFLKIGTGNVVHVMDDNWEKTTIEKLHYANGIEQDKSQKYLYVAATTSKKIYVYEKATLQLFKTIDTETGVDNISLDSIGNLYVGCHPQVLKFLSHAKNPAKLSPSEIIKIENPLDNHKISTVYLNLGEKISASSVAVPFKNRLLVGPVFQNKVLVLDK